jgi:hypothetical protein
MNRRDFLLHTAISSLTYPLIVRAQEPSPPPSAVAPEEQSYTDIDGRFELALPPKWEAVSYQDGTGKARVDIIYRDRAFGLLKITNENLPDKTDIKSFIQMEIDQNLRFRPAYVFNNIERFVGQHLRGELLQYDFSQAGQPKKGRNYYLTNNNANLWVLRFTGNRNAFSPLRNESDSIARSFKPLNK